MRRCPRCETDHPATEFAKSGVDRQGNLRLSSYCKACNREYQRDHYKANSSSYKERANEWRREHRNTIYGNVMAYLVAHPCVDCGEADPIVLQFDHVRGNKVAAIASMIRMCRTWAAIAAEIEKCAVRCANCHTRKTAKQMGWRKHLESTLAP
jgi:hypothetical protein